MYVRYSVEIMYENSLSRIFGKNFMKVTVILKSWFDERWVIGESKFSFSTLLCMQWYHQLYHSARVENLSKNHCFYGKLNIFPVKSKVLLKKLLKSRFHGNFWEWSRVIVLFHTHSMEIAAIWFSLTHF